MPGVAASAPTSAAPSPSDQVVSVNSSELWVTPRATTPTTTRPWPRCSDSSPAIPASRTDVHDLPRAALGDRAGPTSERDLVVRVYGADLESSRAKADEVQAAMAGDRRRRRRRASSERSEEPTLEIEVDLERRSVRRQAGRRAPRGRDAAGGHRGRQPVRGAEGLRGRGLGHRSDAPQRRPRREPR